MAMIAGESLDEHLGRLGDDRSIERRALVLVGDLRRHGLHLGLFGLAPTNAGEGVVDDATDSDERRESSCHLVDRVGRSSGSLDPVLDPYLERAVFRGHAAVPLVEYETFNHYYIIYIGKSKYIAARLFLSGSYTASTSLDVQ